MTSLKGLVSTVELIGATYGETRHETWDLKEYCLRACQYLLSKQLRSMCFANGRERWKILSSEVFRQLGLVYRHRSPDKLKLIISAALLNAAAVRRPGHLAIENDLQEVCSHVLRLAGASQVDLVEAAKNFLVKFEGMREFTKRALSKIKNDVIQSDEIFRIQTSINDQFTRIMKEIMEFSVRIKGQVPCKYALVGMGSLARNEITPYSDFEHIIVLEEGAQRKENYEEILEFFRWVSVIFQIVLVNFGETIVRFLCVDGLNSSHKKEGDWFYDKHTPCGISPDGFAPQASKNPLGRGQTVAKPWVVELIKPVSMMLQYLETAEDLKNGYNLGDILLKTCFVEGNCGVYNEFLEGVEAFRHESSNSSQFRRQLQANLRNFAILHKPGLFLRGQRMDLKKTLYRTLTLFLASLGRYYGFKAASSFELVSDLEANSIVTAEFAHELRDALSIAYQLRLITYMRRNGQEDEFSTKVYDQIVARSIGINRLTVLNLASARLQQKCQFLLIEMAKKSGNSVAEMQELDLELYKRGIEKLEKELLFMVEYSDSPQLEVYRYFLTLIGLKEYEGACNMYRECLKMPEVVLSMVRKDLVLKYAVCQSMTNRHEKALLTFFEALDYFGDPLYCTEKYNCLLGISKSLFFLERYPEALSYCKQATQVNDRNSFNDFKSRLLQGQILFGLGLKFQALSLFYKIYEERVKITEDETQDEIIRENNKCIIFVWRVITNEIRTKQMFL